METSPEELAALAAPDAPTVVRAFFALEPDEEVRRQFSALARDFARRSRGRAVSGDLVHLTLAFIGDVATTSIPALKAIGDALPGTGAMLEFDTLGAWRASGVAWVAPQQIPAPLQRMHAELRDALANAGFPVDARPFRPHVTLARRCVQPQPRAGCPAIRWRVDRLCLMGSQLRPEGPIYSELAAWPLKFTA
jgi:RNA 2',3'-cyclic 3'-phosphodiesterase